MKTLITHTDLDGRMSAVLFKLMQPNINIVWANAHTIDAKLITALETANGVYVSDLNPTIDYDPQIVTVFDHHDTDAITSATEMVYQHFNKRFKFPRIVVDLVKLTTSYDTFTWNNNQQAAKDLNDAAHFMRPMSFVTYAVNRVKFNRDIIDEITRQRLDKQHEHENHFVKRAIKRAILQPIKIDNHVYRVAVTHANAYTSNIGYQLASSKDVDFSMVFNKDHVVLRSQKSLSFDLGEFAQNYLYGGGHANAASGQMSKAEYQMLTEI